LSLEVFAVTGCLDSVLVQVLQQRRQKFSALFKGQALLWSGFAPSRNFSANRYPFRSSSHFLYFAGLPLPGAVLGLSGGQLTLFMDDATAEDSLWHGDSPTVQQIAAQIGAITHYPLSHLVAFAEAAATIPLTDPLVRQQQANLLGRTWDSTHTLQTLDRSLAEAIIQLRLIQDAGAITAIQAAADVTVQAHLAGMACTRKGQTEAQVRAAMEAVITGENMTTAYTSIVTVQGEVLHNLHSPHPLSPGDLLLADVGAEHPLGWASDVTRTWPVSGQWSSTQRAIYEVVLNAHDACIAAIQPGVEYAEIHLIAATAIATGLVDLGILKGNPAMLVERAVHALFFPHGVGHLLGLDVHDMEDLGDLAGYEPGRTRSDRFGMQYLRLNRPLQAGMVVTIEPGFYQVPALLQDAQRRALFPDCINWERLAAFSDVRGIRIEDDVWVTEAGCQVLTLALPTHADEISQFLKA
jgi:Xaa-Pro aminopeptidase